MVNCQLVIELCVAIKGTVGMCVRQSSVFSALMYTWNDQHICVASNPEEKMLRPHDNSSIGVKWVERVTHTLKYTQKSGRYTGERVSDCQ